MIAKTVLILLGKFACKTGTVAELSTGSSENNGIKLTVEDLARNCVILIKKEEVDVTAVCVMWSSYLKQTKR